MVPHLVLAEAEPDQFTREKMHIQEHNVSERQGQDLNPGLLSLILLNPFLL